LSSRVRNATAANSLQLTLGQALIDLEGGNSEAVRTTFERASELCFALNEVKLLPRVYDGLIVNYYFIRANPEKINQYASEMAAVHQQTGDPRALLLIRRAGCLANFLMGRFESARENMQNLIDMYDAERDGPHAGMTTRDPMAAMSTFLGVCQTILGYVDSGAAKTLAGIEHAKKLYHPVSLNLGLRRACFQSMLRRDTRRVIEFSGELPRCVPRMRHIRAAGKALSFKTGRSCGRDRIRLALIKCRLFSSTSTKPIFGPCCPSIWPRRPN
jgi:hypothetical protein